MPNQTKAPDENTMFIFDADGAAVDNGLFGPGSMSWQVWSHPAAFVGVIRSFITEMVTGPEGAEAAANTGLYKVDPLGRLQRTMHYFLTVVYADTPTVEKANARLNRMHKRITGVTPVNNQPYSAVNPLLQLGVHVLTWHSVWVCYEVYAGKQSKADEERYFAESARAAAALGLDKVPAAEYEQMTRARGWDGSSVEGKADGWLPSTRDELVAVMNGSKPGWCITPETRDALDTLLAPKIAHDWREQIATTFYPVLGNAAALTLPRRMRAMASIPTSKTWEARTYAAGKAAVAGLSLPGIRERFEHEISPRGYALMHEAFDRTARATH